MVDHRGTYFALNTLLFFSRFCLVCRHCVLLFQQFNFKFKLSESFYTVSFEYHCASIQHFDLGCMNVLPYVHIYGPVCMKYRSSETNYQYGYRHNCIYMDVCMLADCKSFIFYMNFYWCNLLTHVDSVIIVR